MFLSGCVEWLKMGIERKTGQSTTGWPWQCTRTCVCIYRGAWLYTNSVSKEILPEMSALVLIKG